MEKDLLNIQLSELDSWITRVRDVELRQGGCRQLPPTIGHEDVVADSIESLLRAQVQELEGWLIKARARQLPSPSPVTQSPESDEELLRAVYRERAWSVRRPINPTDETLHAKQRIEFAADTLVHMQEAEVKRMHALQQIRDVGLQTAVDFTRLSDRLRVLESDPMRVQSFAKYSITDVALALVHAIEKRRGLAASLEMALRAQEAARSCVESYEQLVTCEAALSLLGQHAANERREAAFTSRAPARYVMQVGEFVGTQSKSVSHPKAARLRRLADKNRMLWDQLYLHWGLDAMTTSLCAVRTDGYSV